MTNWALSAMTLRRLRCLCLSAMLIVAGVASCTLFPVRIISGFGDTKGGEGYPRSNGPHRGVDIAGAVGTAVIAPAEGSVLLARDEGDACGNIVMLQHRFGYRTVYCHLSSYTVAFGDEVTRGQVIGYIGTTGRRAGDGYEHVHWELRAHSIHEDPVPMTIGCFDTKQSYPTERLVLTWPLKC
jgi:murein DD-endopeptidase MepM/ murein hydrolase activator NlpD